MLRINPDEIPDDLLVLIPDVPYQFLQQILIYPGECREYAVQFPGNVFPRLAHAAFQLFKKSHVESPLLYIQFNFTDTSLDTPFSSIATP